MRKWCTFLCLFLCGVLHSEPSVGTLIAKDKEAFEGILQTADTAAIEWAIRAAPQHSLIIFDVGEVLLTREDALLHRKYNGWVQEWAECKAPHINDEGWRELQAVINKTAKMKLVSGRFIEMIQEAKSKATVIALSKYWQGKADQESTFEQQRLASLKNAGIDFGEPFPDYVGWRNDEQQASYGDGLILTEAPLKGPVLLAFLKHIRWRPQAIVFVDDRRDQCESIVEAADSLMIPCICLHYTEAVDHTPPLDPLIADLQLSLLVKERRWISDEEARHFSQQ